MGMVWWIGSQVWPALAILAGLLSGYVVHLKVKEQRSEIAERDRRLEEARRAEAAMDAVVNVSRIDGDARRRRLREQSEIERQRRV